MKNSSGFQLRECTLPSISGEECDGKWKLEQSARQMRCWGGRGWKLQKKVSFVRCMSFLSRSFFQSLSYNNICTFGQILSWMTFTVRNYWVSLWPKKNCDSRRHETKGERQNSGGLVPMPTMSNCSPSEEREPRRFLQRLGDYGDKRAAIRSGGKLKSLLNVPESCLSRVLWIAPHWSYRPESLIKRCFICEGKLASKYRFRRPAVWDYL